ncbi:MAG: DUF3576 domain-containing protein [Cryomorphaceae bacterium]|nr:DUF3576 domain-containing protein [Cryomorphaceae bacterium]
MIAFKYIKILILLVMSSFFLNGCNGIPGADARKYPADPKKRIEKNIAEGRGFKLSKPFEGNNGGVFEFASSNELWRASLDILDFMPLASVNYSGGIIVTDWYSNEESSNESIKISIRFLSNEIRSDALDIKIFNRTCVDLSNCVISKKTGNIESELKVKILKTAAVYKSETEKKKK